MSKKKKNKKDKIVYIDDGSSFVDMSGVGRKSNKRPSSSAPSKFQESFQTYIQSVKLMLIPMFITIGIICIAFLILWLAFGI